MLSLKHMQSPLFTGLKQAGSSLSRMCSFHYDSPQHIEEAQYRNYAHKVAFSLSDTHAF